MDDMFALQDAAVLGLTSAVVLSLFSFLGFSLHTDAQVQVSHHQSAIVQRAHTAASQTADRSKQGQSFAVLAAASVLLVTAFGLVRSRRAIAPVYLSREAFGPRGPPAVPALIG
jgi:hypothetical protein